MNGTRTTILIVFFAMSPFYWPSAATGALLLLMSYLERRYENKSARRPMKDDGPGHKAEQTQQ